jgi:hypothetical protein
MKNLGFIGTLMNYHVVDRVELILPILATALEELKHGKVGDAEVIKRL